MAVASRRRMPRTVRLPTLVTMYAPRSTSVAGRLLAAPAALRARIEENIAAKGLVYPWWIPLIAGVGLTACLLVSLERRDMLWPPGMLLLTLGLVTVPAILQVVVGARFPHVIESVAVFAAAGVLLANPVPGSNAFDPAPALLALLTAEVVARDGVRNGLITAAASVGLVLYADQQYGLYVLPVHLVDIVLGFVVGYMLLWQMRALIAERSAREGERARATLAERERIAREIHDLVAHSLSVTLLQITGARHALGDLKDAGDAGADQAAVAEIDEALGDAERVGRQAMADIRQTVSTLTDGPSATQPLPGAADIADLVAQMDRAGLTISYEEVGDPSRLAQATGLGIYRIAQESLANIAKHAPAAAARMQLTITSTRARLLVRNPQAGPVDEGGGSGLAGMRARADQLGAELVAGPDGADWVIDLEVPLRERDGMLWCPRLVRRMAW